MYLIHALAIFVHVRQVEVGLRAVLLAGQAVMVQGSLKYTFAAS
jgi:hypothetical protein